ncbi:hypothetical protein ACQBAU_05180 [Propionibacteriaceae bacterium Y2011]
MITSPQSIRMSRNGVGHDATVAWESHDGLTWTVSITCAEFGRVEARADDAFEALCHLRDELEPLGWRIGVAGAQVDVWPSGMARDQGGGKVAYRVSADWNHTRVDTFEPVDPDLVATVAEQRAEVDRIFDELRLS